MTAVIVTAYHGSNTYRGDFGEVHPDAPLFFTPDPETAENYAMHRGKGEHPHVVRAQLNFKNPLEVNQSTRKNIRWWRRVNAHDQSAQRAGVRTLRGKGYDGVVYNSPAGTEYVVLDRGAMKLGHWESALAEDARLQDLINVQMQCVKVDGKPDDYMYGLLNGLICADAAIDGKEAMYPDKDNFREAKSTLTLPDLAAGTKVVDKGIVPEAEKRMAREAERLKSGVGGVKTEVADYMKYIRFAADIDGYNPVIMLFDYVKPEKATDVPVNTWMVGLGLSKVAANEEIDSREHVARVSCTCPEYAALFARANQSHDAHHGFKPKKVDARELGYGSAEMNAAMIPGLCTHLYLFYGYLKQAHRLK